MIDKDINIIWVDETASTNSLAAELYGDAPIIVAARRQTAGRGQRGNSWEAEAGMNLTFSVAWRPAGVAPRAQFAISECVALAVCDLLALCGVEGSVKWPNDIYVGDRKVCGILIEHAVMGCEISRSIAGVGINVNQTEFRSDAPNPVSIKQITGQEYELEPLLQRYATLLAGRLALLATPLGAAEIHSEFKHRLWRGDGGWYPFRHPGELSVWQGRIVDILPEGFMRVEPHDGAPARDYAFKEVEFVLNE